MNFPQILEELLKERGIDDSLREEFLHPDYSRLHNPLLLPDIVKARDRVIDAIERGEHIAIYSDYDADGIPGAVVLSDFFKRAKYENVSIYIPHRHDEGFGLNSGALDEIKERDARLLITVDCGTADKEEVSYATSLGIDVIITDHHESNELPNAYAVVNPKRKDSKYPWSGLCGAAVAYKLVQAVLSKESFGIKEGMEKWSLDMVGIATLSDMVSLRNENRVLARFGLEVLRKTPRPGLAALMGKLNMDQKYLTEDDIAFMITPRINAASRMGVPMDAFTLLSTGDQLEAEKYAAHLEKINNERKGVVASLVKDAKKHLSMREKVNEVVVVGNPEWRPALLGLVANSLVEEYARPVFVWGRDGDGVIKGSCRSYNGYDLYTLMSTTPDLFIEFGGHAGAGGFSLTLEQVAVLEEKLSEIFNKSVKVLERESAKTIPISISDVCEDLWRVVSLFSPFGMENEKPVFELRGELKSIRQFGKENNHLEVVLTDGFKDIKAIEFFKDVSGYSIQAGSPCTLLGTLEKSYFRNRPELRLRIIDIIAS